MTAPGPIQISSLPDRPDISGPTLFGLLVLMIFLGGFGYWSSKASLTSAASATGAVVVETSSKPVQHLEGGIIAQMLVSDGDLVTANQPLIRLDTAQAQSSWALANDQLLQLTARAAKLQAENAGLAEISYPARLYEMGDAVKVAEVIESQNLIFSTKRNSLKSQRDILNERMNQLRSQIQGSAAQVKSTQKQISLLNEELKDVTQLVQKGLARKARQLALERQMASLQGSLGELKSQIARANEAIGEARLQIIDLQNNFKNKVAEELRDVRSSMSSVEKRLSSAQDILKRQVIRAPAAGKVSNLKVFSAGAVIVPGQDLMEIVPQADKLVIDARIQPLDIDVVVSGLPAQIRLSAFKQRTTPTLQGTVRNVSADILNDKRTGQSYYKARIEIDKGELGKVQDLKLYPGMPAEILIVTGQQTLMDYLLSPIKDSFNRALIEG